MYFPILRGKQFELAAIRDFAQGWSGCQMIVPIIEPVKANLSGLSKTLETIVNHGLRCAVILNPKNGDFRSPMVNQDIYPLLTPLHAHLGSWIPAYFYRNNATALIQHAEKNTLQHLMVILEPTDNEDEFITRLLDDDRVEYVAGEKLSRKLKARLIAKGKNIILIEDNFKGRDRNSDYLNNEDEIFTDSYTYYDSDNYFGVGDYLTMEKDFAEGGSLPYAIAVHLTYPKSEDTVNVHHFVSDNNWDKQNIRGKFHEAAVKIAPFYREHNLPLTAAVNELMVRADSTDIGYPGLGYLKKLSILNHLELVNRILSDKTR